MTLELNKFYLNNPLLFLSIRYFKSACIIITFRVHYNNATSKLIIIKLNKYIYVKIRTFIKSFKI